MVVAVGLLLLACSCALLARPALAASAASEESAPPAAAAAAPFVLPARPTRPAAGALLHTPVAVPAEGEEDETAETVVAPAVNGRSAARSAPSGSSARSAAATGSAPASSARRRARHTPRRFQHSGIVAPSGQTVSPREAWQQADASRRARRTAKAAAKKRRAAAARQARAARGDAEAADADADADADSADADADVDSAADAADSVPAANFTLPFDDPPTLQSRAAALAHAGFSVLHYDVTLSAAARNMDDDLNVLQLQCAPRAPTAASPNATLALRLIVVDADAAMDEYTPGAVLHGSSMWGCGDAEAGTVMGRVDNATRVDDHSVSLLLSHAGYEQLFDKAEIIFQQPKEEEEEQEEEDEEMEGQTAAEAQPSDASASAPSAAPVGRGPRRRVMALPPSTGSMPFDFPTEIEEHVESSGGAASGPASAPSSPAASSGRSFRSLGGDLDTWLVLPSGLLTPRSLVTLRVWTARDVKDNHWKVTLRRYNPNPLQSNTDFGTKTLLKSCPKEQWCDLVFALNVWPDIAPSPWGYYFEVKTSYSCAWLFTCSEDATSDQFWLPVISSGSLVGDGKGNPGISAYSRTCDDLRCSAVPLSTLDSVMCSVCTPTRKVSIKLQCDGCMIEYGATISKLYMVYNLEPWNLYFKTQLVADARVDAKLAAGAQVDMSFKAAPQFNIIRDFPIPIPAFSLNIAGVTLGLHASFSLDLQATLDFQGSATVNTRTTLVANMQGSVGYDSQASPSTSNTGTPPSVTFGESPVVAISAAAQVAMEIMLRPTVKIGVAHVAHASLSADAFLRVDGSFQYPPFPALARPYQLPAPVPTSLLQYGSCTSPHLLRYGVTAGVRNVALAPVLQVDIASSINGLLRFADYSHTFTPITLLRLLQVQIVSGCLLQIQDQQPGLDKTLTLKSPAALADIERSALAFNLALDVSSSLGVDAKRVRVQLLDRYQQPLSHTQHHTMALPSTGYDDAENSSVGGGRAMRAQATTVVSGAKITLVSPLSSGEQSAAAVAQSLNEQMALSSSDLSRGVAASRFVPPVSYSWGRVAWSACSCATRSQNGAAVCSGSDGSTTELELCGSKQASTTQACVPSGCNGQGGVGGGGGGGSGDADSNSGSSGVPILWIGVGVGGGVALLVVTVLLAYFCYFKPRQVKTLTPAFSGAVVPADAEGMQASPQPLHKPSVGTGTVAAPGWVQADPQQGPKQTRHALAMPTQSAQPDWIEPGAAVGSGAFVPQQLQPQQHAPSMYPSHAHPSYVLSPLPLHPSSDPAPPQLVGVTLEQAWEDSLYQSVNVAQ